MNKAIVGQMDTDEFEAMVETFIEHRSGEDDRLPAQTFFEVLARRQMAWRRDEPVRYCRLGTLNSISIARLTFRNLGV